MIRKDFNDYEITFTSLNQKSLTILVSSRSSLVTTNVQYVITIEKR